jgi:DNA-binding PadR family transcriptional regulator
MFRASTRFSGNRVYQALARLLELGFIDGRWERREAKIEVTSFHFR